MKSICVWWKFQHSAINMTLSQGLYGQECCTLLNGIYAPLNKGDSTNWKIKINNGSITNVYFMGWNIF